MFSVLELYTRLPSSYPLLFALIWFFHAILFVIKPKGTVISYRFTVIAIFLSYTIVAYLSGMDYHYQKICLVPNGCNFDFTICFRALCHIRSKAVFYSAICMLLDDFGTLLVFAIGVISLPFDLAIGIIAALCSKGLWLICVACCYGLVYVYASRLSLLKYFKGPTRPQGVECLVCREVKPLITFTKCGHIVCKDCFPSLTQCHICRGPIKEHHPIYLN